MEFPFAQVVRAVLSLRVILSENIKIILILYYNDVSTDDIRYRNDIKNDNDIKDNAPYRKEYSNSGALFHLVVIICIILPGIFARASRFIY